MIGCSGLNIGLCMLEVWCSNREGETVLARFAPFSFISVLWLWWLGGKMPAPPF